ncbi:hypothetical protein RT43_GL002171 [Enterococcus italicus DSM 15952]|nr:hypothetical protein RT43_GL002171 [Enterococcus italicus DSM 15952]
MIKRRSVAKEVADKGRIQLNGKIAKSGTTVKVGDELQIQFGNRTVNVRVEKLQESTKKEDASSMYTLLSDERVNA